MSLDYKSRMKMDCGVSVTNGIIIGAVTGTIWGCTVSDAKIHFNMNASPVKQLTPGIVLR